MPYKQRFLIDSEFCAFNTISKSKWRNPTVITAAPAVRVLGSGAVHLVRQQHEAVTRHAPPTWDLGLGEVLRTSSCKVCNNLLAIHDRRNL